MFSSNSTSDTICAANSANLVLQPRSSAAHTNGTFKVEGNDTGFTFVHARTDCRSSPPDVVLTGLCDQLVIMSSSFSMQGEFQIQYTPMSSAAPTVNLTFDYGKECALVEEVCIIVKIGSIVY